MPNKTFFNLSSNQQEEIIAVSLEEFASHDYESVSINKIISTLGIAKGSFYRYFDSKKDLYLYLIDYTMNKKLEFLKSYFDSFKDDDDIFEVYKQFIFKFLEFDFRHPMQSRFFFNALQKSYLLEDLGLKEIEKGKDLFLDYVIEAQKHNQIKKEIDPEFVFFCVAQLSLSMEKFINHKLGFSYDQIIEIHEGTEEEFGEQKKQLKVIFDQLVNFLRVGLQM